MPEPQFTRKDVGAVTVLRIDAALLMGDPETDDLFDRIAAVLDEPGRRCFVLDVGAIQYFASAALGKLVGLNRKARQADVRLALCAVTPTVARVLEISRLSDVLVRYDDEEQAVRALS